MRRRALLTLHLLAASLSSVFFIDGCVASATITNVIGQDTNETSTSTAADAAAAALAAFTRDAEIDAANVTELLARPIGVARTPLDAQLDIVRVQCRELNVLLSAAAAAQVESASSVESSENHLQADGTAMHERAVATYCRKARHVRHKREQMRSTLRAELARIQHERDQEALALEAEEAAATNDTVAHDKPHATAREPLSIELHAASSLDFQTFFETYAEPARPVVLTTDSDDMSVLGFASDDDLTEFRLKCFDAVSLDSSSSSSSVAPLRVHDAACAPLLERFEVPRFLVHDYVRRTNVSLAETYLPSLITVPDHTMPASARYETVVACPHGLHMLAVALPTSAPLRLDVNVFDERVRPFVQRRAAATSSSSSTAAAAPLEEVALAAASGDVVSCRHVVDDDELPPIAPLYRSSVALTAGSVLFVPGSQFASVALAVDGSASSSSPPQAPPVLLLRFCYADASNFNAVKQAVAVDALVDAEAQTLAHALQSHAFDRSMHRRPVRADALWRNFVAWPKTTKLRSRRRSTESLLHRETGSSDVVLSRRERLKLWQDDRRWDRHVAARTLPVSLPPVVVNATRTSVTLRFQNLYEPLKHDITAFGYVVRWRAIDDDVVQSYTSVGVSSRPGSDDDSTASSDRSSTTATTTEPLPHKLNITRHEIERSALPTTLFGDDFDGKDIQAVVRGLRAETRYVFTVQIYVSDTSGLESDSSRIVQTSACSAPSRVRGVPLLKSHSTDGGSSTAACATLQWLDPVDDGGRAISLYLLNARIVETGSAAAARIGGKQGTGATAAHERVFALNATRAHPVSGGSWQRATVCPFVPGAAYVVRIAAMNAIGAGPWSAASDGVALPSARNRLDTTASTTAVPTLKGRGDPAFVAMQTFAVSEFAALVALHGPDVVLATLSESEVRQEQQQQQSLIPTQRRRSRVVLSDVREQVVLVEATAAADDATDALQPTAARDDSNSKHQTHSFDVWTSHFSPRAFDVSAEIVLAEPLDASAPLRNAAEVRDRVVVVARGGNVPLAFKAFYAQQAGALGVIIADVNDTCRGQFDQQCVPGADRSRREGFAMQDRHAMWTQNRIPCVLALYDASQHLLVLVSEA